MRWCSMPEPTLGPLSEDTENEQTYEHVVLNPGVSEDDRRAALYLADRVAGSDPVRAAGIRARWER